MALILDPSVALTWAFADEITPWTQDLLKSLRTGDLIWVPAHWTLELANGLLVAIRRGRASRSDADEFVKALSGLRILMEPPHSPAGWLGVLDLAHEYNLTAYDAEYLSLALRERLPLATLDSALARAARRAGVRLVAEQ